MKKIENITIHRNCNYGSVLQTYATQVTFEELGFECETIDFIRELDTKRGALKRLKKKSKKLASNPILLAGAKAVMLISYLKKEKTFNAFLSNHVNLSQKAYHSNQELKDNIPNADAYCTGSDQIWNSFWNEGVEPAYYLDFVPEGAFCFSYASSIGQKIADSEKNTISAQLKKYSYLSVRESQSVKSLNDLGYENVVQVLDPTLYRTNEVWDRLASNKFKNRKFVVTYNLHHDKTLDSYAQKLAQAKGLELLNSRVINKMSDAKLLILGQGGNKDYLERLIKDYKLEDSIKLLGYNPYIGMIKTAIESNGYEVVPMKSLFGSHSLAKEVQVMDYRRFRL